MNEDDHCRPDKPCPKGFKEHANDETGTCFPTKHLLRGGGGTTPTTIIHNDINNNNEFQFTTPTGYNATFYDANTPYYWYTVNTPPCFDTVSNSMRP